MSIQFVKDSARLLNSGQTRTLVLSGNIYDLFPICQESNGISQSSYVPLLDLLCSSWNVDGVIIVIYEINGPIRFLKSSHHSRVRQAYIQWRLQSMGASQMPFRTGTSQTQESEVARIYDESFQKAATSSGLALELMRQMCLCSRSVGANGAFLSENLIILIEGADMILPEAPITQTSDSDRQRVMICQDWFSDPGFVNGNDSVVLIAESRSQVHHRISRLPQIMEVEVESPDYACRLDFIRYFNKQAVDSGVGAVALWAKEEDLAELAAGLSLHALNQMLKGARHEARCLDQLSVVHKVEQFIKSQVGDEVIEFKKPEHRLNDLVGFTQLKKFLEAELIPRFNTSGPEALPGAAVSGPIGGGKTYIFEAVASELGMVVLVLKGIRSKWYGETDVIFERLRRVLKALSRVLIFIDEADTQLGGVGAETMDTERRLTGKIQSMMSDPLLRGKVFWLLVTARIHLLSPDIRRPGRVGDLIIPVLDPEGDDRVAFIRWMIGSSMDGEPDELALHKLLENTSSFSAASFASIRSELKAIGRRLGRRMSLDEIIQVLHDRLDPAIAETRRYQTLQALINCTRRQLLPDPLISEEDRLLWHQQITLLEARGIR